MVAKQKSNISYYKHDKPEDEEEDEESKIYLENYNDGLVDGPWIWIIICIGIFIIGLMISIYFMYKHKKCNPTISPGIRYKNLPDEQFSENPFPPDLTI